MTVITSPISLPHENLRPFDVRRDLDAVANLVEMCFAATMDDDGRRYIQQMHTAARNPAYLSWAAAIGERVPLPLTGYIWEQDGQLVGNLSLIPFHTSGRRLYLIANVAVHPDYRRRGIARSLTQTATDHAGKHGAVEVWLHVRAENNPAIYLYRSLGFQEFTRRTTWEYSGKSLEVIPSDQQQALSAITFGSPQSRHWEQHKDWLRQLYPPEVAWHMPFKLNAFRPGFLGAIYRFLLGRPMRQWAAFQDGRLLGILSWQPQLNHSDHLWLATSPELEDIAIQALFAHAGRHLSSRQYMTLDYPALRGVSSFQTSGLAIQQALIWMRKRLKKDNEKIP